MGSPPTGHPTAGTRSPLPSPQHPQYHRQGTRRLEREFPAPPPGPALVQWSMDGAFVPVVGGEWAEVKTAAIGVIAAGRGAGEEEAARAEALSSCSRLAEAPDFRRSTRLDLHRRGLQAAETVVAVTDGAEWIQGIVDTYRRDAARIPGTRLRVFPHALGHLAQAAAAALGPDTPATRAWVADQAHTLKHDAPEPVLAALRALPLADAPDPAAATALRDRTLGYLESRLAMLRSPDFRARGYPIGSGAMESACKLVVAARLKGSGMHWARANVSPMVALRACRCSGRWAEDWPTILQHLRHQEQERRHLRLLRRRTPAPPPPAPPTPPLAHLSRAHQRLRDRDAPKIVAGTPTKDHPWRRPCLTGGRRHQQAS